MAHAFSCFKKIIATFLLAALLLTAAGCQKFSPAQEEVPHSPPAAEGADTPAKDATPSSAEKSALVLPNGWPLEDFTVAGFDKDGPGDFGYQVTLTTEEQNKIAELLEVESWQELSSPIEHGAAACLQLSNGSGKFLFIMGSGDIGTVVKAQCQDTGESTVFTAPAQVAKNISALASELKKRANALETSPQTMSAVTEIAYPEAVPAQLESSPVYAKALSHPAVILCDGQVISGHTAVDAFLQAAQQDKNGELYLYSFFTGGDNRCFLVHFTAQNGEVREASAFGYGFEEEPQLQTSYAVSEIYLTDYGYLVYHSESSSAPCGYQVISDLALYDNAAERQEMYHTYLEPICYSTALGRNFWSSSNELTSWISLFEDIYNYENDVSPFDVYNTDWPVEDMAALLSRYFDGITPQTIIAAYSRMYDPSTGTLHYEGGRGGGPFCLRVTSWRQEGNLLSICYENYDFATGIPYENAFFVLTVRLLEDGSFHYVSNLADNSQR